MPPGAMPTEEAHFLAAALEDTGTLQNKVAVGAGEESDEEIRRRSADFNLHSLSEDLELSPQGRHQICRRHGGPFTLHGSDQSVLAELLCQS